MKKVLFATTALVATAGVASAQGVEVTGYAEMGIFGGNTDNPATPGVDESVTRFFTDIDVRFRMSGETDNGLTFGAGVDLDEVAGAGPAVSNNNDDGGAFFFLSGEFGTVTMGDTDGALDWALTEAWVGNAGSINDDETEHAGALGAYGDGAYDGQILRYDYTFGGVGVAVSAEMDDTGVRNNGFAVGVNYAMDLGGASVGFGAGYQTLETGALGYAPGFLPATTIAAGSTVDILGLSANVETNGFSAGLQYATFDYGGATNMDQLGLGVGYTSGAFTVSANWGQWSDVPGVPGDASGFGLAAGYDLGGGASILAGYGSSDVGTLPTADTFSLGVSMSF